MRLPRHVPCNDQWGTRVGAQEMRAIEAVVAELGIPPGRWERGECTHFMTVSVPSPMAQRVVCGDAESKAELRMLVTGMLGRLKEDLGPFCHHVGLVHFDGRLHVRIATADACEIRLIGSHPGERCHE